MNNFLEKAIGILISFLLTLFCFIYFPVKGFIKGIIEAGCSSCYYFYYFVIDDFSEIN